MSNKICNEYKCSFQESWNSLSQKKIMFRHECEGFGWYDKGQNHEQRKSCKDDRIRIMSQFIRQDAQQSGSKDNSHLVTRSTSQLSL